MPANDRIHGLVLAGGHSRRMGRDKALLAQDGETQLARSVRLLRQELGEVYVSARAEQADEAERARFPQIIDRYEGLGPIAGILSAMDEDPAASWLVLACDLPNVDRATIRLLLEWRSAAQPFTAYRSSRDGLPEPLCAIYAAASRAIIERFVSEGVACPRKIMLHSDTLLLAQPRPDALDNINTPDDLARTRLEAVS